MVRTDRRGSVFVVTLDRPERRNAVDREHADRLSAAFRDFEADESARVAVLHGIGNFCAGADLKAVADGKPNRVEADGDGPMGPSRMLLSKPVIAAVSGHAVAGGLELAIWADLRVVERDAVFGVFCRRFGVPLIDGGTVRLPRLIGLSRAMDLILTGRPVGAEEALAIGLANRVVEPGQGLEAAVALAEQIGAFPQAAMRGDRLSAHEQWSMSLDDALQNELRRGMPALAEAVAGAGRFSGGSGRHGVC